MSPVAYFGLGSFVATALILIALFLWVIYGEEEPYETGADAD